MLNRKGIFFIVSSTSGGGKSTVIKRIKEVFNLHLSVSVTTRKPRNNERDGVEYYFVDKATFIDWKNKKKFLETELVYGNYYGTLKQEVIPYIDKGRDVIGDLDVKGALNLKQVLSETVVTIFLNPPSKEIVAERLMRRGLDSSKTIEKRLEHFEEEVSKMYKFDYSIVNNNLDNVIHIIKAIIISEGYRPFRLKKGG